MESLRPSMPGPTDASARSGATDLERGDPAHGRRLAAARGPAALSPSPTDRACLEQGRRAFACGDDAAARRHLARVLDSGLRFADVHYMLGLIEEREGELDRATASLREAIRINPTYVEALLALASVCEQRGDFDQAAGLAERADQLSRSGAAGLDPTTRGKLANQQAALADALAGAGLRRDAIEQYRQALDRCPTYHDIRHRLGVTLREAGLPYQALLEFERILDARPELLESRIQLGLTCYAMGRADEAIHAWREVLALDPTRREAAMYLRLVRAAPSGAAEPATETAPESAATAPAALPEPHAATPPSPAPGAGWSTRPLVADRTLDDDSPPERERPFAGAGSEGDGEGRADGADAVAAAAVAAKRDGTAGGDTGSNRSAEPDEAASREAADEPAASPKSWIGALFE
ncbi:MAG: tetratricopeptide repeat protein [Myxococcota bacterium]